MSAQSIAQTLAMAQALVEHAQAFVDAGDQEQTPSSALDDYKRSSNASEQAAMLCGNVTGMLASQQTNLTGIDAATQSVVQSAEASNADAGNATDPTAARTAAVAGITAASQAITYARQAANSFDQPARVTIGWFAAFAALALGTATYFAWRLRH